MLAEELRRRGLRLRSGHADGSDLAFEEGAMSDCDSYLPWSSYNRDRFDWGSIFYYDHPSQEAYEIAGRSHPAWHRLSDATMTLHARNAYQVLGDDLRTPSLFVACWTSDGAQKAAETSRRTGGTGTAIRIAEEYDVPVFNLARGSEATDGIWALVGATM